MARSLFIDTPKIFLCHASGDKPFVEWLARKLRSLGIRIWVDIWEIRVGDSIVEKINEGISTSDYLAVALSKKSVASPWVREELNSGILRSIDTKGAFVLPLLLEDCDIPPLLSHRRYADFRRDREQGLRELFDAITPSESELRSKLRDCLDAFDTLASRIRKASQSNPSLFGNTKLRLAIMELNSVLEAAVHLRFVHEAKANPVSFDFRQWNVFYEELMYLESLGFSLRSKPVWGLLRNLRNTSVHPSPEHRSKDWSPEIRRLADELNELKRIIHTLALAEESESAVLIRHPTSRWSRHALSRVKSALLGSFMPPRK